MNRIFAEDSISPIFAKSNDMKKESRSNRNDKRKMYPLVEKWESGSQSKASFCQAHGLSVDTFRYWYNKYKRDEPGKLGGFVPLEIEQPAVGGSGVNISIRYPNGVSLELGELVEPAYLAQLIKWEDNV